MKGKKRETLSEEELSILYKGRESLTAILRIIHDRMQSRVAILLSRRAQRRLTAVAVSSQDA